MHFHGGECQIYEDVCWPITRVVTACSVVCKGGRDMRDGLRRPIPHRGRGRERVTESTPGYAPRVLRGIGATGVSAPITEKLCCSEKIQYLVGRVYDVEIEYNYYSV